MAAYIERTFSIPELKGISKKSIDEHLKLYSGYVKHSNLIQDKIAEYSASIDQHGYALGEIQRRFGFEFNGMRNHEYYFASLEGGATALSADSEFKKAVEAQWGSFDTWLARIKSIAMTRGIGWAITYFDAVTGQLVNTWVDEQHLGQLNGLSYVVGIDMWEHAYFLDVVTDKKKYVEAYFENINWSVVEHNFVQSKKI
jgi:Fe-Mn family superoxide dismutase